MPTIQPWTISRCAPARTGYFSSVTTQCLMPGRSVSHPKEPINSWYSSRLTAENAEFAEKEIARLPGRLLQEPDVEVRHCTVSYLGFTESLRSQRSLRCRFFFVVGALMFRERFYCGFALRLLRCFPGRRKRLDGNSLRLRARTRSRAFPPRVLP